jgi:hypothetical protein
MNKHILTFAFLLFLNCFGLTSFFAQKYINETVFSPSEYQTIQSSVSMQNHFYVIFSKTISQSGQLYSLNKYNQEGEVLFSNPILLPSNFGVDYVDSINMITSHDGSLILFGTAHEGGCDFLGNQFCFISKYDALGNQIWTRKIPNYTTLKSNVSELQNDNFIVKLSDQSLPNSTLFEIDNSGVLIDSVILNSVNSEVLGTFSNYYYISSFQNNVFGIDQNGDTTNQTLLDDNAISTLRLNNDSLVVFTSNSIRFLDINLLQIGQIDFPNFNQILKSDTLSNGNLSLFFIENGNYGLLQFDGSYTITDTVWFNDPLLTVSEVSISDSHVLAISTHSYQEEYFSGIRLQYYDYTLPPTNNFTTDVELLDVTVLNTIYYSPPNASWYIGANAEIVITIVNNGSDTIQSLTINSKRALSSGCGYFMYRSDINNLNLLPNDTLTTYLGWIGYGDIVPITNPVLNYNFCVYLTSPNQRMDLNYQDNRLCKPVSVYNSVEENSFSNKIHLFPNPTQNEFFISLENFNEPNLPFKIMDISGKVVLQSFANTNTAIDISNLPNGYYIVQVEIGGQYLSKSLIVNRL